MQGHHSTKIEAIARRILWIKETDRGAKVIVFSTWLSVLQLIAKALEENEVLYKMFDNNSKHLEVC